jgi:hypothetical protein
LKCHYWRWLGLYMYRTAYLRSLRCETTKVYTINHGRPPSNVPIASSSFLCHCDAVTVPSYCLRFGMVLTDWMAGGKLRTLLSFIIYRCQNYNILWMFIKSSSFMLLLVLSFLQFQVKFIPTLLQLLVAA